MLNRSENAFHTKSIIKRQQTTTIDFFFFPPRPVLCIDRFSERKIKSKLDLESIKTEGVICASKTRMETVRMAFAAASSVMSPSR